jgi:hypothetical protein
MLTWNHVATAWNGFFHAPEPPTALALFRIAFGLLLIVNSLLLWKDLARYFGPRGLVSAEQFARAYGQSRFTLCNLLPHTMGTVTLLLAVHLVAACGLSLGLWTRASAVLAFVTLVSLHHRNPCVLHSGDTLQRLLLFLLVFSHAGDALSADVLLAGGSWSDAVSPTPSDPWCQRLMQLQVSIVYLRTAWWKLQGQTWINGTAAYYPAQLEAFARFPIPRLLLSRFFTAIATWGTLLVEIAMGTLVWFRECRLPVLLSGCALHLLLEYSLNLQLFGWTMVVTYLLFVDPHESLIGIQLFIRP